jgi:hypothetical protein
VHGLERRFVRKHKYISICVYTNIVIYESGFLVATKTQRMEDGRRVGTNLLRYKRDKKNGQQLLKFCTDIVTAPNLNSAHPDKAARFHTAL